MEDDMKATEDRLKPTLNLYHARAIIHTFWLEVEKNQQNLEKASLWHFLLIPLEPQNNTRTRQFLHSSVWGSKSVVDIDGKIVHFSAQVISELFKLPQGTGSVSTEATALTSAMLKMVFDDKKAKTRNGFQISKARGIWKDWLPWVNEQILMAECGLATISEEGLAVAIMAWQGVQLSWGNIIYEQMKLEMMKKHGRSSITFYNIPYITYLTSSSRQHHAPGPNASMINSCTVVQSELTPGNPPAQAHLIQVGHWSDIPGPSRSKKQKQALSSVEAEETEVFEVPPYRFNSVLSTLL